MTFLTLILIIKTKEIMIILVSLLIYLSIDDYINDNQDNEENDLAYAEFNSNVDKKMAGMNMRVRVTVKIITIIVIVLMIVIVKIVKVKVI